MAGKYLRRRTTGRGEDPTMTWVSDPSIFAVGDYLRDSWNVMRIKRIDEAVFGNPDIRFAHLSDPVDEEAIPEGATIHDLRTPQSEAEHRAYLKHIGKL
jgi:hypothetical protein